MRALDDAALARLVSDDCIDVLVDLNINQGVVLPRDTGAEIDVSPLLSHMLPIEEVGEAFRTAHDRTGNALKVSIKF